MGSNRRLKVILDLNDEGGVRGEKRQRKLILSMDRTSTIGDLQTELAKEIGSTVADITLQLDGFDLRPKDFLDVVEDNETICAVVKPPEAPTHLPEQSGGPAPRVEASSSDVQLIDAVDIEQFKVYIVSAELARQHARTNPKNTSEPSNGLSAFNGESVGGSTPLSVLRREVARLFNWEQFDPGATGTNEGCVHVPEAACSCPIALEIERSGLFSTLHCRFTVDGLPCSDKSCPYSHISLEEYVSGNIPPHCSVCLEALGFPCPTCMQVVASSGASLGAHLHCPLVQNVSCGHLHHAHCLGARTSSEPLPCPSGCPIDKVHRESRLLDAASSSRCLIIAWDGDKIERIPLPSRADANTQDLHELSTLSTNDIIKLVERFLEDKLFKRPHLSIKIHGRDPVSETTRFFQSTLVSVCSSTKHPNQNYRRFNLFSDLDVPMDNATEFPSDGDAVGITVDLHTSLGPILACPCTTLRQLFPSCLPSSAITMYAVRRAYSDSNAQKSPLLTKQGIYLSDISWQPSTRQTDRGIAALLSSLYLVAHTVSTKGKQAELAILAMVYAITRFPPAVRALGILLMNESPSPEARVALAESLYHCLLEFSASGPTAIVEYKSRTFETVRILLGHILSALDAKLAPVASESPGPLEVVSLVCSISQKLLKDPVAMGPLMVERSVYHLQQPGGELYRPSAAAKSEIIHSPNDRLSQIVTHAGVSPAPSSVILNVDCIGLPPPACSVALDSVARDFSVAIRYANRTDLATRGPLELKSPATVAPQIVLDKDGYLAVFIGRGCGSTRDVNFFRPVRGGDTEVDVNDVAHGLQNVVASRIAENTWQVDSYEGVSSITHRPPDEAIVLCLDLSQSMNSPSGVNGAKTPRTFDFDAAADELVADAIKGIDSVRILDEGDLAKAYVATLSPACLQIWSTYSDLDDDDSMDIDDCYDGPWHDYFDIISELRVIARREAMKLHQSLGSRSGPDRSDTMLRLACFISASDEQISPLANYLEEFAASLPTGRTGSNGNEPFDVPLDLLDPRTGDLLTSPVRPLGAPSMTLFVNEDTNSWLEDRIRWPIPPYSTRFHGVADVQNAVDKWMSGEELLPSISRKGKGKRRSVDTIAVTFHHNGQTTWDLPVATPIRTLYALVHRATAAKYRHFSLRHVASRALLNMYSTETLGTSVLSQGGAVEVFRAEIHRRWSYEVEIQDDGINFTATMLLPSTEPILTILSWYHVWTKAPLSLLRLWNGFKNAGDGVRKGQLCEYEHHVGEFALPASRAIEFEVKPYKWVSSGSQRTRESSKNLSRLHLLRELFNVFLNRAASFDTSVALVLGLVTFSDEVNIAQELTPVFENFREALDKLHATGDTAIYDALDEARRLLSEYRTDLPNLRKRIIIVTDGQDTSSSTAAHEVCYALQRDKVVVDSVQVGGTSDTKLHGISVATGGYRLCPKTSLSDALSIFDLETMLFSGERPSRPPRPFLTSHMQLQMYGQSLVYPIDIVTVDEFPKRAEHTKLQEGVKPAAATSSNYIPGNHVSDDRTKRIMREVRALVVDPHPQIDLYVNEKDISFLKVILEAPSDVEGCPYKGGCFLLTCDFPSGYPRAPPEIRFVTFILHPNVSKQGKVCIAELGRLWSSDISIKDLFNLVYGLLLEPDLDNPLEIQASLKYYDDDGTYALAAANAVKEHASKTRKEWRDELEED